MKKLILETTAPFQGLPELVAYDEGLFAKEGLDIEWADREAGVEKKVETACDQPRRASTRSPATASCSNRARPTCTTPANGAITAASRRPARQPPTRPPRHRRLCRHRGAAGFAGLYAAATRQPHHRRAVLFRHALRRAAYAGRLRAAREIRLCRAPNGSRYRLDALMKGEIEATTLTEPHVTLAEKKGCRIICAAFFHGTEVASDRVDAETYAAFNRAVREAVRRINADKRAYLHYFIDYYARKGSGDRRAQCRGFAREPARRLRSGADPARRDCSAPMTGSKAGACWKRPLRRCSSSTCRCRRRPMWRRNNRAGTVR